MNFSSVNKFEENGIWYILKVANDSEREITVDQIKYLLNLKPKIKNKFPQIISYTISEEQVSYIMPYYDMTQLDEALLDSEENIEGLKNLLVQLVNFMCNEIYSLDIKPTFDDFLDKTYFNRIDKRLTHLFTYRKDLENLINKDKIRINGLIYSNVHECMKIIKGSQKLRYLCPTYLSFTHGDLEANHIMFDTDKNTFILLDPRYSNKGGDLAYDLGKLYQSLHGMSNELINGKFEYVADYRKDIPEVEFNIIPSRPVLEYEIMQSTVNNTLSKFENKEIFRHWKMRMCFAEACHFISAPPFYMDKKFNNKLAEALYIQGIISLNEFISKYINS